MSADTSTGSPPARGRPLAQFSIHDDSENNKSLKGMRLGGSVSRALLSMNITDLDGKHKHSRTSSDGPSPLATSKLGNMQSSTLSGGSNTNKVVSQKSVYR